METEEILDIAQQFAQIDYSERVVLLPQCLRSKKCAAQSSDYGRLECQGCYVPRVSDNQSCYIPDMIEMAKQTGYKETHIFMGGRGIAPFFKNEYIQTKKIPGAVLAVACGNEVNEGLERLAELNEEAGVEISAQIVTLLDGPKERNCSESNLFFDPDNFENEWRGILTRYPPKNGE